VTASSRLVGMANERDDKRIAEKMAEYFMMDGERSDDW
jgi:hypothetical protein